MADPALIDARGVAGGAAQPVVIMNQQMPSSGSGTAGIPSGGVQSVQGVQGGYPVAVGGTTFSVTADFTRPANVNPYAQYDIVSATPSGSTVAFLQFDTGKVNSSGYLTKFRLETNRAAEAGSYRLWLYRVPAANLASVPTNLGDNDLFPLLFANRSYRIGYMDFASWVTGASGSDSAVALDMTTRMKYGLAVADSKIYALLVTNAVVTPANAQQFSVSLSFESNT